MKKLKARTCKTRQVSATTQNQVMKAENYLPEKSAGTMAL